MNYATQISVQIAAALSSIAYAFVVTLVLVKIIDLVWGFTVDAKEENEGLDGAEHGEVGFDLGMGMETAPVPVQREPRSAMLPPLSKRHFTIVVEGALPKELMTVWSKLCGGNGQSPPQEFKDVYPYMTTVQGNRFNFRGGDSILMREAMTKLFADNLEGSAIQTHVEH
jgi:hypothetical protein